MPVIVKKFGGSSIATIELIRNLAQKLAVEKQRGDDIVVVVSAMAKTTDYLFDLAKQISATPYQRELDMLVTAGERISMSLLSIALHKLGIPAISFTGSQSGIITDNCHGNAKIVDVNAFRIKEELQKGKIVIAAGFQGVSREKEITTLGRGGSDTSAVALAGYLNAAKCEMFKDVEGIYSADPKTVPEAVKLQRVSYHTMLFLAHCGCKAVHPRAINFAMKYNVPIEIKSAFTDAEGTMIVGDEDMDEMKVNAVTGRESVTVYELKYADCKEVIASLKNLTDTIYDLELLPGNIIRFSTDKQIGERMTRELQAIVISEDNVKSISMIGNQFAENPELIADFLAVINEQHATVVWMTTNPAGLTFYLKNADITGLIPLLHKRIHC